MQHPDAVRPLGTLFEKPAVYVIVFFFFEWRSIDSPYDADT
jgi:hypothetical protein